MSNIDQLVVSTTVANATTAGNTELAIATVSGIQTEQPSRNVLVMGWASFTASTNITSARLRIEQGGAAGGTAVADTGVDPSGIAASTIATKSVLGMDTGVGPLAGGQYTMTITTAGGTPGNSTIQKVCLVAVIFG